MTSMIEMGKRMYHMFATFVPADLFPEFYADLVASEPDITYDVGGKIVRITEVPYDKVTRWTRRAWLGDVQGAYVYLLYNEELYLTHHLGDGYQFVPLDEVWDMGVTPVEPISDDILAEML